MPSEMKYAIISDVHGNLAAFKAALADAKKRGCGKIVCLGDLTGYGDDSVGCVKLAMKRVDVCLMGNHDSACCGKEDPFEVAMIRNYDVDVATRELLSDEQILFVGHTHSPLLMKMPAESVRKMKSFDESEAQEGLHGLKVVKGRSCTISPGARYVINVGSIGLPREGSKPTYAIYDATAKKVLLVTVKC